MVKRIMKDFRIKKGTTDVICECIKKSSLTIGRNCQCRIITPGEKAEFFKTDTAKLLKIDKIESELL